MAKNFGKVFTSGLGTAEPYAYLVKPDYGNEAKGFGNPRGVYKLSLTLPTASPRCQAMINEIVATHEEAYAEALADHEANPPAVARGKKPLVPYEGDLPFFDNGDGTTTFKFSSYASYTDKKTKESKPLVLLLVDSQGKRLTEAPAFVGGGSKLKVKYKIMPYKWNPTVGASVKLQLESVMIVELVAGSQSDGGWGDDDREEGGYTSGPQSEGGWSGRDAEGGNDAEDDDSEDGDF
ncbi:ssDNA-binding protein [Pectobacterium phage Q19]|uniref:Single-stranded DNA-binding protein n=1 Tax=Pectobacterium phage Q19 TaxID=2500576 RepID=A0A678ZT08_9CAUD|nr:ssDNA-binding protein [Pectobacterium phage Q19]